MSDNNDLVHIPDNMKGGPAAIFKAERMAGEAFEDLGEGISAGYAIIGINGKEFYLRHRNVHYTLLDPEPDENGQHLPSRYFDFVILRKSAQPSHTWYKNGYQPGAKNPPECVSTDGIAPDDGVSEPQSNVCQVCPRHEWKDLPNGRKGRECTDSMRLAVLPMPKLITQVLGMPITEPCLFRIPAASMSGLATLGDQMAKRFGGGDAPLCSFVCRVTFTSDKFPKFQYRVQRWLSDTEAAGIMELRKKPMAFRILGQRPDGSSLRRSGDTPVKPVALPPGRPPKMEVIDLQPVEPVEEVVLTPQAEPVQPVKPALQAVPDADADIDALVQAMRPKAPGA
jgi:hypothetical protein